MFDIPANIQQEAKVDEQAAALTNLAARFVFQAKQVYHGANITNASPLYAQLSLKIAEDHDLLALNLNAYKGQPIPNLFLSAVHDLLLRGIDHPLRAFFPSLTDSPLSPEDAYPHFRTFCLQHAEEIQAMVDTRRVQTNEVQRCSSLLPAFETVYQRGGGKPLALIEIGPSAGLLMRWDTYGYDYGIGGRAGNVNSPVQLRSEIRGEKLPPIPAILPPVAYRIGIDLYPVDVRDSDAARWLRALIWPEHTDRAHLLIPAIQAAQVDPPHMIAGDALALLPGLLAELPAGTMTCVYHSFAVHQFSRADQERLGNVLLTASYGRTIYRISLEWWAGQPGPKLELETYQDGLAQGELLANCESHGRWIEWVKNADAVS